MGLDENVPSGSQADKGGKVVTDLSLEWQGTNGASQGQQRGTYYLGCGCAKGLSQHCLNELQKEYCMKTKLIALD